MQTFGHSGDIGDIIYSLPTIKAKGGGSLVLFDYPGRTAHGMTEAKVNRLRPLLESQPYITSVRWSPSIIESSLNGFRDHMAHGSLADAHLATHGLSWVHRIEPWLAVDPNPKYRVIFSRSPRYHNHNFPWKDIVHRYGAEAAFVGFRDEYEQFCNAFGYVRFAEDQADFLQLAQLIAGCEMFVGNQSSPLAVAHGLKHNLIMEICPGHPHSHCVFERANCLIGWGSKIELPCLHDITPKFSHPRDYELWREVYHGYEYALPFNIAEDTLVVDIGAHIGAFALSAIHRGAKHVICVEPCQTNIEHLERNLSGTSFEIIPKALYKADGHVQMGFAEATEGTIMHIGQGDSLPSICWSTLLKHLVGYKNIIVKCDAEGAEYLLCDPANDLSSIATMHVETHDNTTIDGVTYSNPDCMAMLRTHGFDVRVTKNGPNTHIIQAIR